MIGIVDYGMGNIHSIYSASQYVGIKVKICKNVRDLNETEKIILPGVGAFGECMKKLKNNGMFEELNLQIIKYQKPILGICLGMQIMASKSFEFSENVGFNWIEGKVEYMKTNTEIYKMPHVGWNSVDFNNDSPIFKGLPNKTDFYFVHSYYFNCKYDTNIEATFSYDKKFVAAVRKKNIFGIQFHPEKSQDFGLIILENFKDY